MPERLEISHRIEEFLRQKGWSKAEFSRRMGIVPQSVNLYLQGKLNPENLFMPLQREGADIGYIMTGQRTAERVAISLDDQQLLAYLKELGIDTLEKLRQMCSPENIAADVALVLREKMSRYKTKRRRSQ